MTITRLNPDGMYKNPAFSQAVVVTNPTKFIYVGGQNGVDVNGKMVGKDISSQSERALKNVITCLEAAGAGMEDVLTMTIYIVQGHSLQDAFAASERLEKVKAAPASAITVAIVAGLANPEALIEIEAVAAVN